MSQLSFKDHVVRNVVSGLIVTAIAGTAAWFIPGVWLYLTGPVETSRWWYWFLLGFFIFAGLAYVGMWVTALAQPHRSYRDDWFFGLKWEWDWTPRGSVGDLWCRCDCGRPMEVGRKFGHCGDLLSAIAPITVFQCLKCQSPVERNGELDYVLNTVRSEIELKVREKSYPGAKKNPARDWGRG